VRPRSDTTAERERILLGVAVNLFDLSGKVAVVTGGNRGIGLGMAKGLAEAGATIAIAARDEEAASLACSEIESRGGEATFVRTDVGNEDSCRRMINEVVDRLGHLEILVNNAGFNIGKPPETMTVDEFHQVMNVNLVGAFVCSQAAYPHLRNAGGGKIINVASGAAFIVMPGMSAYAPSKAAMIQMARVMATTWAKDNIQVNSVVPGWIDTDMTREGSQRRPGFTEQVIQRTPAGRWGVPDDFAGIAVYLASRASDFMTGSVIVLDGGYTIKI
jgi:2-dehydro-3-deoxy-D-gluconate 5-dehydrogenase